MKTQINSNKPCYIIYNMIESARSDSFDNINYKLIHVVKYNMQLPKLGHIFINIHGYVNEAMYFVEF